VVEMLAEGVTLTLTASPPNTNPPRPDSELLTLIPEEPEPNVDILPDKVAVIGPAVEMAMPLANLPPVEMSPEAITVTGVTDSR
jgi:hypothetical protein